MAAGRRLAVLRCAALLLRGGGAQGAVTDAAIPLSALRCSQLPAIDSRLRTVCAGCSPKPGAQATGAEGTLAATPAIVIGAAGTDQQEHSASEAGRRRQRWDVGAAGGKQQRTVARGA